MRKVIVFFVLAALLLSPWLIVHKLNQRGKLTLNCQVPFTINSQKANSMLMDGMIKSHYYSNGRGIAILSGNLHFQPQGSSVRSSYTMHRNASFAYQQSHSYITTQTQEMHPAFGESIPDNLANEYIFPTFKAGFNDYYQIQKIANGDMMVSVANMPRLYCHTN